MANCFAAQLADALEASWPAVARPNQLPPQGDWQVWLLLGEAAIGPNGQADRKTPGGVEIAEDVKDIFGSCWSQDSAAGCGACGYEGAVRDFSALPPGVVSLNEYRHRR